MLNIIWFQLLEIEDLLRSLFNIVYKSGLQGGADHRKIN